MTVKKTYFDHQSVAQEILAALVISGKPFNVAQLTAACSSAPDRQAVSDTLRRLKLATPALIQLTANKRWRYNPEHIDAIKLADETIKRVSLNMSSTQRRPISVPQIRRAILAILHANTQAGQNLTPYHVILETIGAEYVIERRQLSQILNIMKNEGEIGLPDGRKRFFFVKGKPETQASLFDNELPIARASAEPDAVIEDTVFTHAALETPLVVAPPTQRENPSASLSVEPSVSQEDPGTSPHVTSHVTDTAPIEKKQQMPSGSKNRPSC